MPIDPFIYPDVQQYVLQGSSTISTWTKSELPITSNRRREPLANIIWEQRNKQKLVINNCFWASGIGQL